MSVTSQDNVDDVVDAWDLPVPPTAGNNIHDLLSVLVSELQRTDTDIEGIYGDRFLDTATGKELGKIGDPVDATRQTGESDDHFRQRIQSIYGARSSDATYDAFAQITLSVLDAGPSDVSLDVPPQPLDATVTVQADSQTISNSPFTESEITDLLQESVTAGHDVVIEKTGTFAFDGDDGALEGFDQGTWSSTE